MGPEAPVGRRGRPSGWRAWLRRSRRPVLPGASQARKRTVRRSRRLAGAPGTGLTGGKDGGERGREATLRCSFPTGRRGSPASRAARRRPGGGRPRIVPAKLLPRHRAPGPSSRRRCASASVPDEAADAGARPVHRGRADRRRGLRRRPGWSRQQRRAASPGGRRALASCVDRRASTRPSSRRRCEQRGPREAGRRAGCASLAPRAGARGQVAGAGRCSPAKGYRSASPSGAAPCRPGGRGAGGYFSPDLD